MFDYDSEIDPYLPKVGIKITNPHNQRSKPANAIIDTGADFSCVPYDVVYELGLNYKNGGLVQDFQGQQHQTKLVSVQISFLISESSTHSYEKTVEAVLVNDNEAIIGRDILNDYKLVLNAPRQKWGFNCSCMDNGSDWSQSGV